MKDDDLTFDEIRKGIVSVAGTYDHDTYVANCKMMIEQNKSKVKETRDELERVMKDLKRWDGSETFEVFAHSQLEINERCNQLLLELEGWVRWWKRWEDWLRMAHEARQVRENGG